MMLADMGAGLGQRFISANGGTTTQCANYGVIYEHEFKRDADRRIIFDADYIAACRSRMVYKMQKLAGLLKSGKKILFIRAYASTGVSGDRFNDAVFTSADLNRLVAFIEACAPTLTFNLLFIHSAERVNEKIDLSGRLSSKIVLREMPHPPDMKWYGIDSDWIALFEDFGLMAAKSHSENMRCLTINPAKG